MKKIISVLLCLLMLCSATVFAAETETVGGKITLSQFLGVSREEAKSVAITVTMYDTDSETAYVDKNAFYDISDNFILTSSIDPEPMTWEGIYITVEKNDGCLSYAFMDKWGFADRYGALMSRIPYGLYNADDLLKVNELTALGKPPITVNSNLDITVNGRKADFSLKPFIDKNSRTLVPAKEFCAFINKSFLQSDNPAVFTINPHSDTTSESGGDLSDSVIFRIGEKSYEINGKIHETDASAQLVGGNIYVPLRTVAELLGYNVLYSE